MTFAPLKGFSLYNKNVKMAKNIFAKQGNQFV